MILDASREELEGRALAAFQLNTDLIALLRVLTDESSDRSLRWEARAAGRKVIDAFDLVQPINSDPILPTNPETPE